MKKEIKISQKDASQIIDTWAKLNVLCACLNTPKLFTEKFNSLEYATNIYKLLDKVVANLPDSKL